jgi:hypothetical protein
LEEIMPDLYRATFSFAGEKQGWSESYVYPLDNSTPKAIGDAVITPIALARANLLAKNYVLDAFRVAKIRLSAGTPVKRNVKLFAVDLAPALQTLANQGDQPRDCVMIQAGGTDGQGTKFVFMRGIPDAITGDGGAFVPAGAGGWGARFSTWAALQAQAHAGWLEDAAIGDPFVVTGYVQNPGFTVTLTFAGTPFLALPAGTIISVRLSGINGRSKINGLRKLQVLTNSTATTVKAIAVGDYAFGGVAQRYNLTKPFQEAQDWAASQIRTHDTGRPSYATRGRRAAQPLV